MQRDNKEIWLKSRSNLNLRCPTISSARNLIGKMRYISVESFKAVLDQFFFGLAVISSERKFSMGKTNTPGVKGIPQWIINKQNRGNEYTRR
jgi:hypothetical protein